MLYPNNLKLTLLFWGGLFLIISACNQDVPTPIPFERYTAPLHYVCYRVADSLVIDGDLSENDWAQATWSKLFIDIEGEEQVQPHYNTRMKMLWDSNYLYIAAHMEEEHLWATLTQHDAIVYRDNDFEVFIDPDGDTHHYYEIEVNAFNTILDLLMVKPYRNGGPLVMDWELPALQSAIGLQGTLNNPKDTDTAWTVEMAIPLKALRKKLSSPLAKGGDQWRINFSRVQWDLEATDSNYIKKKGSSGAFFPEHNWVWSPQGLINMHYPEKWGYLQFSDNKVGTDSEEFAEPVATALRWKLRQLYYRQKLYYAEHGRYAASLDQLQVNLKELEGHSIDIYNSPSSFEIIGGKDENGNWWKIDHNGLIREHLRKNSPTNG